MFLALSDLILALLSHTQILAMNFVSAVLYLLVGMMTKL